MNATEDHGMTGPGKYLTMGDPVGAFVPHSLPPMTGSGQGPLVGHTFAVKDLYHLAKSILVSGQST